MLILILNIGVNAMQFIHQCCVYTFQGGFPDSPICSDGAISREGSSSDTDGENFRGSSTVKKLDASTGNNVQNDRQSPTASKENGKVW